jgi:two-component system, NtrC family, response regulator AtoC
MARILVADDEEGIRSFLAEALELDGHEVSQAEDGAAAARLLAQTGFDLLLTDLKMPGLDGMALLAKVRAEQPEVEVIVITAHGTVDSAVEAMKAGAYDYLQKPIASLDELRLLVARALERRALVTLRDSAARDGGRRGLALEQTWQDPAVLPVVEAFKRVAPTSATVLLLGESGTGKEVAARAIHRWSERADGPFMAVNCAALTETLLESELFGHEKGAFTGAHARRRGRVELARGGTFFLDEIGELKPALQAKLLRVLQERRFERVGGSCSLEADVRWIAATNRDLRQMLAEQSFREDLYHRLAVFPIQIPPLRERPTDIPRLAAELLPEIAAEMGRSGLSLSAEAVERLSQQPWPGNVRELRNTLERAVILARGDVIESAHLWLDPLGSKRPAARPVDAAPERRSVGAAAAPQTLEAAERASIDQALAACGGNRKQAAETLGIGVRTLYEKLKRYRESD